MNEEIRVGLAGSAVQVIARDPASRELLQFLFSTFPQCETRSADLSLELDCPAPPAFGLSRDGTRLFSGKPGATAAQLLLAEVIHCLTTNGQDALILHAAAVTRDGFSMLLPGRSGAGKSTLSAWLDFRGYGCISDELVGLTPGGGLIAFPRPVCLEPDAHEILASEVAEAGRQNRLQFSDDVVLIKGRSCLPATLPKLGAIVFPEHRAGAKVIASPVSKSKASVRLLGTLANADHFEDRGFAVFGAIARDVEIFELSYGDLDVCGDAVLDFFEDLALRTGARSSPISSRSAG